MKCPERSVNSTKTATSLIFCESASSEILPPYVVYKAEFIWSTWTENGPPGARYNQSKSGWFDALCFEVWFTMTLLPRLKKSDGKNVVIGDYLSSHINVTVLEACKKFNVAFSSSKLYSPNSTFGYRLLQTHENGLAYYHCTVETVRNGQKTTVTAALPKDQFPNLLSKLIA